MTVVVTPMLLINICTYLLRMGAAAVGDASPRFEILWGRHPEITIFEKKKSDYTQMFKIFNCFEIK